MIDGNITGLIQVKSGFTKNALGERVQSWSNAAELKGYLDLQTGNSSYTTHNAKMQESSHIFVADYKPLDSSIKPENSRMLIDGEVYDVMLIDDPMGLHKLLEIYLKYTGGQ